MKVISLKQPWASLVMIGAKENDTRSWGTRYRGPLGIHASAKFENEDRRHCWEDRFYSALNAIPEFRRFKILPQGAVLGWVDLVGCQRIDMFFRPRDLSADELAFGDYSFGRFVWRLANPRPYEKPIPAKGERYIWDWAPSEMVLKKRELEDLRLF